MRPRRHLLHQLAAGALAGACPKALLRAQPSSPAQAAPSVLRIGVASGGVGHPVRHGGTTVALLHASGALERALAASGTQVSWVFFKGSGPAVNEALVNQQLDLAWQGELPAILHRAAGVPTRILAASGVRTGVYLGVPKGSPLRRLEDLRGKRVSVIHGSNYHLAALRALAARGLKDSDLRLVNLDAAGAMAALSRDDVDAAFGYVELFYLRDQGHAEVVWSAHADSLRFTRQAALLGTEAFVSRHPQTTQQVVTELVRVAHAHSAEQGRAELFAQWGRAELPEAYWREDFIGQPLKARLSPLLDPFFIGRYQEAADEALALKLIRRPAPVAGWFEPRFVQAALRQLKLEEAFPAYAATAELVGHAAGRAAPPARP